ncbi:MAG: nuclear transport factor 2 family protein, partial [Burkholderiales bacterium]
MTRRRLLSRATAIAAVAGITLAAAVTHSPSNAQSGQAGARTMTAAQARQLVAPFYDMLNRPATKDVPALANSVLAPGWRSFSGENVFKGREEFVAQVGGFGRLIPDLTWDIKDVLVDGNR